MPRGIFNGAVDIYANQGQVEIGDNGISGSLIVNDSTGSGPDQESLQAGFRP